MIMNDNQHAALFQRARENLSAAELLMRAGMSNIAASRAYYAMFYVAEALLLQRGQVYSSHSAVIAAYGKEFARSKDLDPKFHRYLIATQNTRWIGDYGIEENVSRQDANQAVEWAEEFINAAEVYLQGKTSNS
jgi:uncharacterized protein (UPF0332 family)